MSGSSFTSLMIGSRTMTPPWGHLGILGVEITEKDSVCFRVGPYGAFVPLELGTRGDSGTCHVVLPGLG